MNNPHVIDLYMELDKKKIIARQLAHSGQYHHADMAHEEVRRIEQKIEQDGRYDIRF